MQCSVVLIQKFFFDFKMFTIKINILSILIGYLVSFFKKRMFNIECVQGGKLSFYPQIRPSGTLPTVLAGGRRVQPPVPPVPPPQAVTSLHSSNDSGFSNEPPVQPDIDYSDDEAMR